ncbi:MAG: DUF3025 domain-containing protein [Betaproteobacteria bacterium]|nr:DUF3025 domain-containing protein [Betaproteobacteria bacterium]
MAARVVRAVQPWLEPHERWARALDWPAADAPDIERLNAFAHARPCEAGSGQPLRFVESDQTAVPDRGYERLIFDQACVPTRLAGRGARHDFANALAWLAFPRLKARLNALHVEALADARIPGQRGRLRDRATLFDESGALVVTSDARLAKLIREFRWRELFVDHRNQWATSIRVLIVGHALLEKLCTPYKSICAQAWLLDQRVSFSLDQIDAAAAGGLDADVLASLTPLPIMGIPGWLPANEDPTFYNDPKVFRTGRRA